MNLQEDNKEDINNQELNMDLQDDLGEDLNSQQVLVNDVSLNQI